MNTQKIAELCITPLASVREAMQRIDKTGQGIALIVDDDGRLITTVTDGDVRRAILDGVNMDLSVQELLERRPPLPHPSPVTALVGTSDAQLLSMMNKFTLRHIPLVDNAGRVVDLALLGELIKEYDLPLRAVVMAGGYGTRLRPLTEKLPKPMLPVGDRPVLEVIIEQLRQAGIRRLSLTTHYKRELIAQHFGDGRDFGIEIRYVEEDRPLGTAGALSLLEASSDPLLVINGDILTRVDFRAMLDFHREQHADMTVAVRQYEFRVPYGVIETEGVAITGISEKPVVRHFINAGIYLLSPEICGFIPNGQPYDMPDLIGRMVAENKRVVSFPIREYWLDIGQVPDYEKALADKKKGKV